MQVFAIFDPQGRQEEIMSFAAHTISFDENNFRLSPTHKGITNGMINLGFKLSQKQLTTLMQASSIGVMVQGSYEAGIFLGIEGMPFESGKAKFLGLLRNCW